MPILSDCTPMEHDIVMRIWDERETLKKQADRWYGLKFAWRLIVEVGDLVGIQLGRRRCFTDTIFLGKDKYSVVWYEHDFGPITIKKIKE